MMKKVGWAILLAGMLIVGLHCASGEGAPSLPAMVPGTPSAATPTSAGDNYLWGVWQISIEKATGEVAVTRLRQCDLALNVTGFLEPPALKNLSIDFNTLIIDSPNNYIGVDVMLTHPLKTPDAVFTGFDVRGVVFGPEVRNADGWTAMMNPEDFSGVPFGYVNGLLGAPYSYAHYQGDWFGYKYFCDGLGLVDNVTLFFSNETNLEKRGIFKEGQINRRHYDLYFGGDYTAFLVFNYAVVASYNWPTGSPPYDMADFDISTSNVAEPFCGNIINVKNNLARDPLGKVCGYFSADIEVWDWQGLGQVEVSAKSDILAPLPAQNIYDPGSTSKSGIFHFSKIPAAGYANINGDYIWFVCTDASQTFGSSWFMGLLDISHPRYNQPVFTTYGLRVIPPDNTTPIAAATADKLFPAQGDEVTFDASNSYDAQSELDDLKFDWDLDGDGEFDDDTGLVVKYIYNTEGNFNVDMRVTDPCGATDTLDEKLVMKVTLCGLAKAHIDNNKTVNISGFSAIPNPWGMGNIPRYAIAFLSQGPYAGRAVMQSGPYSLGTFDADSAGNVTGNTLCKLRPYYHMTSTGPTYKPILPLMIDVCPKGGYILVVTDSRYLASGTTVHVHKLEAYSPNGTGTVFRARDTRWNGINAICALDCDDNGDIWVVGFNFMGKYYLVRIPYTGGTPPWDTNINNYQVVDITNNLDDVTSDTIIDMAVDYADDRIYIFHTGVSTVNNGKLAAFDLSTGTPIFDGLHSVNQVFSDPMDVTTEYVEPYWMGVHLYYAGIEIDHVDAAKEKCRIVVYSRCKTASGSVPVVKRFNHLAQELDSNTGGLALQSFAINNDPNPGIRHLLFPATNPLAKLWDTPASW